MLRSPQTLTELTKLALQSGEFEVFQQEDRHRSAVRIRALPMAKPRQLARSLLASRIKNSPVPGHVVA